MTLNWLRWRLATYFIALLLLALFMHGRMEYIRGEVDDASHEVRACAMMGALAGLYMGSRSAAILKIAFACGCIGLAGASLFAIERILEPLPDSTLKIDHMMWMYRTSYGLNAVRVAISICTCIAGGLSVGLIAHLLRFRITKRPPCQTGRPDEPRDARKSPNASVGN